MAGKPMDLRLRTRFEAGVNEMGSIDAIEGAFGEVASWYYVPHAEFFCGDELIAADAEAVAVAVQRLFVNASNIDITVNGDVVTVTGKLSRSTLRAEFHIRFGLIGSVRATSIQAVDDEPDSHHGR